ncbi:MAG: GGDEF domain-containing protein [Oscillospiraceae bacterium]|nr:GGDEF domain-containing protein [Oscillospiraceae bacterium]
MDILLILWSYVLSDYMVSLVENIPYKYLLIPMNVLISSMAIGTTAKLFFEQYKQEKNKRDRLISTLEDLTVRDPLTGLYNRAYFMDFLEKQIKIAQKKEMTFSIVMFDLDFFKEINDKHGHMLGDKVLIEVASVLNSSVQSGDIVSRYGGEEFIAVLLDRDKETAFIKSDQIRAKIEKIRLIDGFYIPITISGGVAEYRNVLSIESLLSEADKNLYIAKNSGRNKICKSELEFVDGIY